nr:hypothetical protein [Sicyoidochytrium minutum DNA virus]
MNLSGPRPLARAIIQGIYLANPDLDLHAVSTAENTRKIFEKKHL